MQQQHARMLTVAALYIYRTTPASLDIAQPTQKSQFGKRVWILHSQPFSVRLLFVDCMGKAEAKERSSHQNKVGPLLWLPIVVSTIFVLFILRFLNPISPVTTKEDLTRDPASKQPCSVTPANSIDAANGSLSGAATGVVQESHQNTSPPVLVDDVVDEACDMTTGRWVREPRGPVYTNVTCTFMPDTDNCGHNGKDPDYQFWRWQPDRCELPRFDPAAFLELVRGKTMAFVGDSLSRNHMESLLCLLATVEAPLEVSESYQVQRWQFRSHNFTVMHMWTEYLMNSTERAVNGTLTGSFDIHLDKMNPRWADRLVGLDYLVISGGNWHLRRNYLHEGGRAIGCVMCADEGLPELSFKFSIRKVIRASLEYLSQCKECAGLTVLLRTFTFTHYEDGAFYNGLYCNRTAPLEASQLDLATDLCWEVRNIQLEEMARIRERLRRKDQTAADVKFGVLDVTRAMMMRPDGHPGAHSSIIYGRAVDCLHWCLPGPIDMWSELLLDTLKKKSWLYY